MNQNTELVFAPFRSMDDFILAKSSQIQVKKVKKDHPTLVMLGTFFAAYFFIHLSGCVMVFICGVLLPIKFTILHAALRLRNMKNKIASMAEIAGVGKKTPMAVILAE